MTIRKIFGVLPTTTEQIAAYEDYINKGQILDEAQANGVKAGYTLHGVTEEWCVDEKYFKAREEYNEARNKLCLVLTGMTEKHYELNKKLEKAQKELDYWTKEVARIKDEMNE